MDDRLPLMAAIIANPDEDTPRLVFADWLDEHGDAHDRARAEFIRAGCEVARLPFDSPRWDPILKVLRELAGPHWRAWLGPLVQAGGLDRTLGHRGPEVQAGQFRRGLLVRWDTSPERFTREAEHAAACGQFPRVGVESLVLSVPPAPVAPHVLTRFAASPALGWVIRLRLSSVEGATATDPTLGALAQAPGTFRMAELTLAGPGWTNAGLDALAAAPNLPLLRRLGVRGGSEHVTPAGVLRPFGSRPLPRLTELDVDCDWTREVFRNGFFASPLLSRLTALSVGRHTPVDLLVRCPHLTGLETLEVTGGAVPDSDVEMLLATPGLRNLKRLRFLNVTGFGPPLGGRAVTALLGRFGSGLSMAPVR